MTTEHFHSDDNMNSAQTTPSAVGSSHDAINIALQIVRRKKMVAKVTFISALVGIILSLVWPASYTATVVLMPPQQLPSAAMLMTNQVSGGASSLAGISAGAVLGMKNPNDLYVGLLSSRPIADAIIKKFDLQRAYRSRDMTSCRKTLESNTEVTSEKSGLISISVNDKDKYRVAQIANTYTDQLRTLTQSLALTEASRRALFFEGQLKVAGNALADAEGAFQKTEQSKGIIQPEAQTSAMIGSLAQLRAKVAAQEVTVQAMKSFATEGNPQLALAENELESLRSQVASAEQHNNSKGFSNLSLEDVPLAGLDYFRAQRNVLSRQALYDILLKQYEAAKLDEAKDAASIQVVEPAIVPDRRTSPKRSVFIIESLIFGLLLGCVLALVEFWKETEHAESGAYKQLLALSQELTPWK